MRRAAGTPARRARALPTRLELEDLLHQLSNLASSNLGGLELHGVDSALHRLCEGNVVGLDNLEGVHHRRPAFIDDELREHHSINTSLTQMGWVGWRHRVLQANGVLDLEVEVCLAGGHGAGRVRRALT